MMKLSHLAVSDEGFVFDPSSGDSYTVNHTGLVILRALQEGKDDSEIVRVLTDRYDVTPNEATRDVADFNARLKAIGPV